MYRVTYPSGTQHTGRSDWRSGRDVCSSHAVRRHLASTSWSKEIIGTIQGEKSPADPRYRCGGLLLSLGAAVLIWQWEQKQLQQILAAAAQSHFRVVQRGLDQYLADLQADAGSRGPRRRLSYIILTATIPRRVP